MAPRKPKQPRSSGPLEKALNEQEKAKKAAQRNASKALLPINLVPEDGAPIFHYQNPKHKFGTCWQCGAPRVSAGGSPGGSEAYWCDPCGGWLAVRESPSDPAQLMIIEPKKPKN